MRPFLYHLETNEIIDRFYNEIRVLCDHSYNMRAIMIMVVNSITSDPRSQLYMLEQYASHLALDNDGNPIQHFKDKAHNALMTLRNDLFDLFAAFNIVRKDMPENPMPNKIEFVDYQDRWRVLTIQVFPTVSLGISS